MVDASTIDSRSRGTVVLVVEDDKPAREAIVASLELNGYEVFTAASGGEALARIADFPPDVVISGIEMPGAGGLEFLRELRADPTLTSVPLIFLSASATSEDVISAFAAGADDYIVKPVKANELIARIRAKLERPPIPVEHLIRDRDSGLMTEKAFMADCVFEFDRAEREFIPISFAYLEIVEFEDVRTRFGERARVQIGREMASLLTVRFSNIARLGIDAKGRFLMSIATSGMVTRNLLNDMGRLIAEHRFTIDSEHVRLTPVFGFATRAGSASVTEVRRRALIALTNAGTHLDLQAVRYRPILERTTNLRSGSFATRVRGFLLELRSPLQVVSMLVAGFFVPLTCYVLLAARGIDFTNGLYIFCVFALLFTAIGILIESALAMKIVQPPTASAQPDATAIIAAYLPNEAATILETIENFLSLPYAGGLQIILAYNSPRQMRVEEELLAIAARDSRFVPLRVHESTSKAQNVNAALRLVTGTFVGIFDADHKPDPDSFQRAWNWIASGYDVVQGHCVIRNAEASLLSRMIAVEFESIYAVSHPGRARMHGFGLFGGSNGYWRTELLQQTRMHAFMLTEDIDSSLRVLRAGYRIANDPLLISRELAPTTVSALWNQRLRWAQGWFQASLKHLMPMLRSQQLTLRQKLGIVHLLFWREAYVWIVAQIFPILAFWIFFRHDHLNWLVPFFVITTIVTTIAGPAQIAFTYAVADPEIRKNHSWFFGSAITSLLYYTEFKNIVARLGQLKEFMRERVWKVTPRSHSTVTKGSS